MSAKKRDYDREVSLRPASYKKEQAARARARYHFKKKLAAKHGAAKAQRMMEGKDLGHIKSIASGGDGDSIKNVKLQNRNENRSDKSMFRGKRTTRPRGKGRK